MRCRTPRCASEATGGRRFCAPCSAVLDRVREAIDEGRADRLRGNGKKRRRARACRTPSCDDYAYPGEVYCRGCMLVLHGVKVGP